MPSRSIEVVIRGNSSSLQAALGRSSAALTGFAAKADRAGASMVRTGHTMTRTMTVPIIAAGVASADFAIKFQKSMEMVHTQAGASQAEVTRMTKAVLALAPATNQGPNVLAQGLFHIESVGFRGAKALGVLKVAAEGAAVGNASLEDTASALSAVTITNIKGTKNYSHAMGVLNATIGAGNMRMTDLLEALKSGIVPTAKVAGLSLQGLTAALAMLTDEGVPAGIAANRLRTALLMITNPSAKAQAALKSVGLSSVDLGHQLQKPDGLFAALTMLKAHMTGITDPTKRLALIGDLFGGSRSAGTIAMLLNNLGRVQMKYTQIGKTAGKFNQDVAATKKTNAYQLQQDLVKLEVTAIKVGDDVLPVLTRMASDVAKVADAFSGLSKGQQDAILFGAATVAALGPVLTVVGNITKAVGLMSRVFTAARGVMVGTSLFGAGTKAAAGGSLYAGLPAAAWKGGRMAPVVAGAGAAEGAVAGAGFGLSAVAPFALLAAPLIAAELFPKNQTATQRLQLLNNPTSAQNTRMVHGEAVVSTTGLGSNLTAQQQQDINHATDIISGALGVAQLQAGSVARGGKLNPADIRTVEQTFLQAMGIPKGSPAGLQARGVSQIAGRALAPNEIRSLALIPKVIMPGTDIFAKLTHMLPGKLVTHLLVDHKQAQTAIAAYIAMTHKMPTTKQLKVLSNIPTVAMPAVTRFIEKTGHIPGVKRLKLIVDNATDAANKIAATQKKVLALTGRDHHIGITANTDPALKKLSGFKSKVTGMFVRPDFAKSGANITGGIADGINNSQGRISSALTAAITNAEAAARSAVTPIVIPVTTSNPPHRAAGGPVYSGMSYTVGERGPETFIPQQSGTIIPHGPGGRNGHGVPNGASGGGGGQVAMVIVNWKDGTGYIAGIADNLDQARANGRRQAVRMGG